MRKFLYVSAAIAWGTAHVVLAQQAGFGRVILQTQELSTPGKIAVQVRGEFDPGFATGRHTHFGEELTYILEGEIELRIEGQPPRVVRPGETFFVPAGLVHEGINTGPGKAKVLATYIVEQGKPLAPPVK